MSKKTFKQQVEEILHDGCRTFAQYGECSECVEDLVRILSAHNAELDRIADGMPNVRCERSNCYVGRELDIVNFGISIAIQECQAYIQAQKEGM